MPASSVIRALGATAIAAALIVFVVNSGDFGNREAGDNTPEPRVSESLYRIRTPEPVGTENPDARARPLTQLPPTPTSNQAPGIGEGTGR